MNNLPVYLTDNALCNNVARILSEKTGLPRSMVWRKACKLAGYMRDKRDLQRSIKADINFLDEWALESIHHRMNRRLDKIFSTTYKGRAKRLDNEDQPSGWLMV